MTIGSHELALTIINDGKGYPKRCHIAREARRRNTYGNISFAAHQWMSVTFAGAAAYERQFGTPDNASSFTVEDLLLAAVELSEYYDNHMAETEPT